MLHRVSRVVAILMYQGSYGDTMILPDGRTAVSVNLTGDNHGPHSVEEVHGIFASLRERYPIEPMRGSLPVVQPAPPTTTSQKL